MMSRAISLISVLFLAVLTAGLCQAEEAGAVRQWLLAGPFTSPDPGKLLEEPPLGDLAALAPSAGQAVGPVQWKEFASHTGVVSLPDARVGLTSVPNCIIAGLAYVYSPKMQPARLLLGFQYGASVFLNGRRVFLQASGGDLTPNACRAEVLLGQGWNRLLINNARYTAFRWGHGFSVRLAGPELRPLPGLKLSTKNPYPGGKPVMPQYAPYVSAYSVEHFGTHRVRLVNRTPVDLKDVEMLLRSRAGKELMKTKLGTLKGDSHVEAEVSVDEVFFQQHFPGATAEVSFDGGKLQGRLEPLSLEGAHTIEYETPHVQRMEPWAAGRPVVLLLTARRTRQAVELLQRGDFEWHWVETSDPQAAPQLKEQCSLYKFDCVVVAAQSWRKIPGVEALDGALAGGAGLVCVNPMELTPQAEQALGIESAAAPDRRDPAGRPEKVADHPVISGVPLEALPPAAPAGSTFAPAARPVARVGERPAVVVNEQAGRRAVVLNLGQGAELIWPIRREDFLDARLPVWERQWSLILKSILWASRKEGLCSVEASLPVQVRRAVVGQAKLQAVVTGPAGKVDPAGPSVIEICFRSRGLTGPRVRSKEFLMNPGPQAFEFPLPGAPEAGENEADVVLKTAGKVASWATAVFTVQPRGSVGKITLAPEKDCYLADDKLTFTVPGKADVDGLTLTGRLVDNRGRVVWEQKRPVQQGQFSETFSLQPEGLLTPVGRFQAELAAAKHTEARAETIFFVRQELVWDSYEPVLWLTRHRADWYYDLDYFRMLREVMWIPNGWCADFGPRSSAYYQMVYGGFNRVGFESLHFFSMNHNWMDATFYFRRNRFKETKDKRWLYRTPIDTKTKLPVDEPDYASLRYNNNPHNSYFPLEDPKYLEWTTRKIAAQLKGAARFNPIVYDLMDEGSYTSYARAFDFDHSPVSLKHFRIWLKAQYGTLDALNKEWETNFQDWDAVVPMTLDEAQKRAAGKRLPNYAPWVDHRRYGDIVYNKYIQHCSDAARAGGDADAVVGIGGGQRPNPYGGWDYWLVVNHFTWIENYFADTNEYIRSFNTHDRKLKACPGTDVWYSVMHRNSGFYRWVDTGHIRGDFSLLPRGQTTAQQLEEVRGRGFAKLFLNAEPADDPIAIHYSQSTIQVSHARGGPEAADDLGRGGPTDPRLGFYNLLEELGYQYKFVAYAQVEDGDLLRKGYKLMILPESLALSDQEAEQLRKFVEAGGVLLCDRWTGEHNGHGRKRPSTVLEETFGIDPKAPAEKRIGKGRLVYLASDFPRQYWRDRNVEDVSPYWERMKDVLKKAGLAEPR
ncbi:MAG: hypothetical protein AMJ81_02740, partial [Phycisphaerae bacterium SM23_33]